MACCHTFNTDLGSWGLKTTGLECAFRRSHKRPYRINISYVKSEKKTPKIGGGWFPGADEEVLGQRWLVETVEALGGGPGMFLEQGRPEERGENTKNEYRVKIS